MKSFPLYRDSARQASELNRQQLLQANLGLWFTRFYDGFLPQQNWEIDTDSKRDFIHATVALSRQQDAAARERIKAFAQRQQRLCEALGGACTTLTAEAPLVTGTGLSHPVENGFTFHPTLGVPCLPASGVKGLLRGWVEVWAGLPEAERRERVAHWFGAVKDQDGQPEDEAGALIFFDAVPAEVVAMRCDILTPHMGGWYERGARLTEADMGRDGPGDWHSPVPSAFLAVDRGARFVFGIAPRCTGEPEQDARARAAVAPALAALKDALEWIGAGAKTATGYGRLIDQAAREAQEQQAKSQHGQQELAKAGIALGQDEWPAADVTWNKARVELQVSYQGRSAKLVQQAARDLRAKLSEADLKKFDKSKPVKARAVVEIKGNQITLIDLNSL